MDELEAVKRLWGRERGADEPVVKERGGEGRKGRGYGSTIGYKARPGMDQRHRTWPGLTEGFSSVFREHKGMSFSQKSYQPSCFLAFSASGVIFWPASKIPPF